VSPAGRARWRKSLKNKIYKLLKDAIDHRGPINYHNAMSVAAEIAQHMKEGHGEGKKETASGTQSAD
jgi:hypothetical protein